MAERDQYNLIISTEEPDAADAWREAVDRLCALQEPYEPLRRAVAIGLRSPRPGLRGNQ